MAQEQIWKGSTFTIERRKGKTPNAVIFRLTGPFTARDMYSTLTPIALRNLFESEPMPEDGAPALHIFDLKDVPYMDSLGIGTLVSHYVRCQAKGVRLIATGVSPHVRKLFNMTKVDTLIPMTGSVEEAYQI
jgi:anti-anti-sigma factor